LFILKNSAQFTLMFFAQESRNRERETYAHSKKNWENHTKQLRKESFKSQSMIVKLQQETQAATTVAKQAQTELAQEKKLSEQRQQEAFTAQYQLVGVQQELSRLSDALKSLEQERDALRTIAKNEEIARIAAEGRLPLPISKEFDEFSSPRRLPKDLPEPYIVHNDHDEEFEEIRWALQWEKRRADKAHALVEFLQLECQFKSCSCRRLASPERRESHLTPFRRTSHRESLKPSPKRIGQEEIYTSSPKRIRQHTTPSKASPRPSALVLNDTNRESESEPEAREEIFRPTLDIFKSSAPIPESSPEGSPSRETFQTSIQSNSRPVSQASHHEHISSCEPVNNASLEENGNTSLLSLLDNGTEEAADQPQLTESPEPASGPESPEAKYHTISTSTRIPLAPSTPSAPRPRPISTASLPTTFPTSPTSSTSHENVNETFEPTLTREESLARIASMRGRTRSLAQGTLTPRKQMTEGLGFGRGATTGELPEKSAGPGHKRVRSVHG
jgi:hypothetical protein